MRKKNLKKTKNLVRVRPVTFVSYGITLRVATIEQVDRRESMCAGCPAPCCKGMFQPVLTSEEFDSKKYQMDFIPSPDWLKEQVEGADFLAVLKVEEGGCVYHDHETNLCTIWPDCPKACLAYDCRLDDRPEIAEFAEERIKIWQDQ